MNFYIIVLFSLLNTFNFFDIIKINSHKETKIKLNKDKRYVIFEFSSETKYFTHSYFACTTYPILHIYFKTGYQINTYFYLYYEKKDNIQLENNKFINSNYSSDLYNKNRTWIENLKAKKIYIVVSNFKSNNYEDAITIFNSLDYSDISKINKVHYDIYFNKRDYGFSYEWITFSINNTNLNYSYLHHEGMEIRFIHTDDMEYIKEKNNIISLKENKNKVIYFFFFSGGYSLQHFSIYLETSNYSLLYPLTDIESRTFSHEILGVNSKDTYLFINITDYPSTFYIKLNHDMNIKYYFFETDDFELIESKIPFNEKGNLANTDDLYFSIQKKDNSSIGLVLNIYTKKDIFLSIDFENKKPISPHNNSKLLIIIFSILGVIILFTFCCFFCYYINKSKDEDNLLQRPLYENKNDHYDDIIYNVNDSYNDSNDIIENVNYIKGNNNTITNNNTINKETNIDNHIELNQCKIENNENTQNKIINNNITINIGSNNQVNDAKEILEKLMNNKK